MSSSNSPSYQTLRSSSIDLTDEETGLEVAGTPARRETSEEEFLPLYKLWTGHNSFFCGGRVMLGHNPRLLPVTGFLVCAPAVFDCVQVLPSVKALAGFDGCLWFDAGFLAVGVAVLVSLAFAAFTEPGIIPPSKFTYRIKLRSPTRRRTGVYNQEASRHSNAPAPPQRLTYCVRCQIDRPERARHCRYCNNCVDRFDHHCAWIGNDVGARNYRAFLWFVTLLAVFSFLSSAACAADLVLKCTAQGGGKKKGAAWWSVLAENVPTCACLLLSATAFVMVGFLSAYHLCYLMCFGETTNENLRNTYRRGTNGAVDNPYNRGYFGNCYSICCAPIPKSLLPIRMSDTMMDIKRSEE